MFVSMYIFNIKFINITSARKHCIALLESEIPGGGASESLHRRTETGADSLFVRMDYYNLLVLLGFA